MIKKLLVGGIEVRVSGFDDSTCSGSAETVWRGSDVLIRSWLCSIIAIFHHHIVRVIRHLDRWHALFPETWIKRISALCHTTTTGHCCKQVGKTHPVIHGNVSQEWVYVRPRMNSAR